jgi:signal transduction histidine kinase
VREWSRPDLGRSGYIVVGQPVRGIQSTQSGIRGFLWLSGTFTFIAALIAIWLVAGRALRPLLQVAATAEDIRVTGDLRRRLPESRGWVELNRLARAFNGMLQRLEVAQERLASALEAQRRFVADASHELRTPLTTIQSNAGLLLNRPDVSDEDRREALGDIASEAERMRRLIHDLLTLARADAGQRLDRTVLDLGSLVADVGRQARTLYADRCVSVECAPVFVEGNADALKQLQWILLDNAARFSGPGGDIGLSLSTSNGCARLSVSDDGPGVPPADRERIFERFFQADLARASGGAGLGLSIARWIAAEHQGTLRVEDNPAGRGAVFIADLPVASAKSSS